jgi:hypothetical protein
MTAPPGANPARPRSVLRDPDFPALMEYVRRLSYALSMGRPAASVALYIPSSSMWLNDKAADDAFVSTERMLSERQIDFDLVNDDALATDLKAKPGALETASGNEYRAVIMPNAMAISEGALGRLKAFAKSGGNVLFLGSTPTLIYGRTMLDARAPADDEFSFAIVETSAQLEPTPTPPMQPPASAPGPQVVPPAIEAAVQKAISSKTMTLDKPDTALRVMTRRLKDADVYFFFNETAQPFSHTVTLKTNGKTAESWDAQNATIAPIADAVHATDALKLKLDLKPYETRLVVVR